MFWGGKPRPPEASMAPEPCRAMPGRQWLSPVPYPGTGMWCSPGAPPNPPPGSRWLWAPQFSRANAAGLCRDGRCQPGPRGPQAAWSRSPGAAALGWGHPSPETSSSALPPPCGTGRAQAPKSHRDHPGLRRLKGDQWLQMIQGAHDHGAVPTTSPPPLPPRVPPLSLHPWWLHSCPCRPAHHRWEMRGVSPAKQGHGTGHPGYHHAGGGWGTVPITPTELAGSEAAVPAALAVWAACQPWPAAGLQHDSRDKGEGGDRRPCSRSQGAGGGPARPGSPIAPCPGGLGAGEPVAPRARSSRR